MLFEGAWDSSGFQLVLTLGLGESGWRASKDFKEFAGDSIADCVIVSRE